MLDCQGAASPLREDKMPVTDGPIREAWEKILEVPVTEDTDFFENGGHSLLAVELSMAIEDRIGIEPPPELVYRLRTFGEYVAAPEFERVTSHG
jgi:acyl carrier protein